MMNYRDFIEDNNPILISNLSSSIKTFLSEKKVFYFLVALFLLIFLLLFVGSNNQKHSNKALVAREHTLNLAIERSERINDLLQAEILIDKEKIKNMIRTRDKKRIDRISMYLTDSEVTAEGIEIIISDSTQEDGTYEDESIIHNIDLLKIVNFLWQEGATAISINEERIGLNTAISCVGATILVNKKRLTSPFTIKATGIQIKKNDFEESPIMLSLKLRGINSKVEWLENLTIPATKDILNKE